MSRRKRWINPKKPWLWLSRIRGIRKTEVTPEKVEQLRNQIKKEYTDFINQLLAAAKGKLSLREGYFFYKYFFDRGIDRGGNLTLHEILEYIQKAYWIEEEDLRQQICIQIFIYRHSSLSNYWHHIMAALRDYMVDQQKLFTRQRNNDLYDDLCYYNYYPEREDIDILKIFELDEQFTIFDKYMAYLMLVLDYERPALCKTLNEHSRQVNRFMLKLQNKMEDFRCQNHDHKQT